MQHTKPFLRKKLRKMRSSLSQFQQEDASTKVITQLMQLAHFSQSLHIALYFPHEKEIDLQALLFSSLKKHYYMPCLDRKNENHLLFYPYKAGDPLNHNSLGILEPKIQEKAILPIDLDIVFLPLVAFDEKGNRLGRGAGYYDRTFSFKQKNKKPWLIGVAYEFQKIDFLIKDPWDIVLDKVITEFTLYPLTSK